MRPLHRAAKGYGPPYVPCSNSTDSIIIPLPCSRLLHLSSAQWVRAARFQPYSLAVSRPEQHDQLVEQHGAAPDAIAEAISSISTELKGHTSTESPKDPLSSAAFSNLRFALDEQPQACGRFFGDDLSTVKMLCTSHERAVEYHAMSDSSQLETGLRDQWMAKAFAFIREANPTMNYFGQLGYAHTMQSPTKTQANTQVGDLDSCKPFATLLNEDSSLSEKSAPSNTPTLPANSLQIAPATLIFPTLNPGAARTPSSIWTLRAARLWTSTALSSIKPALLRPQRTTSKSYSCSPACRKLHPYLLKEIA